MAFEYTRNSCFKNTDASQQSAEKPSIIALHAAVKCLSLSPTALFARLCTGAGFLLESVEGNEKIARYSIIGFNPLFTVTVGEEVEVDGDQEMVPPAGEKAVDAVDYIQSLVEGIEFIDPGIPGFSGGLVGFFSYENVFRIYGGSLESQGHHSSFPLAAFICPGDCVVYDHAEEIAYALSLIPVKHGEATNEQVESAGRRLSHMLEAIAASPLEMPGSGSSFVVDSSSVPGKGRFCEMTEAARKYIFGGDIFQVVISREFECPYRGDPFAIYNRLRLINPSPYMYYIDFGCRQVIGASPEMLVRVQDRHVTTVPIAGTRRRGADPDEDRRLAEELLNDEKERAEHTMLLDLARNDIGRVAKYGSVTIPEFMAVEKYSHVQHIVSVVSGELAEDKTSFDAFRSCFPAGTVSGAPKVRAMQIIGELEETPRNLYAGAVGHIGFTGNMDFAIAIRTIIAGGGVLNYRAGAGIVADSVPDNEYYETGKKAEGMARAISLSGGTR